MPTPSLRTDLFHPGQRIAVAVSGGADSVALLRRLVDERSKLGIVLAVAHMNHGIRGEEAEADAAFVAALAETYDLPFYLQRVDAPAAASLRGETLEEAARNLRYAFFERLIVEGSVDAVATAHTLDDQAETVLSKLLRGAWTEGLSGIHPVLPVLQGRILRPFLETTRTRIEDWLRGLEQPWREDATNRDLTYMRNRIRHELLPLLRGYNPEIARQLSRMAAISADEERYWQGELDRLLPLLLLPGRPVRGGGRSNRTATRGASAGGEETTFAMDLARLGDLSPAVARRVLRAAARQLGVRLGFDHSELLFTLIGRKDRPRGRKIELPGGLVAERTLRELRFSRKSSAVHPSSSVHPGDGPAPEEQEYAFVIPGQIIAPRYGIALSVELADGSGEASPAVLRNWRAGDRVTPRHSRGSKRVSEMLDRLHVHGPERALWPVVEASGKIVWMRGIDVDAPQLVFTERSL